MEAITKLLHCGGMKCSLSCKAKEMGDPCACPLYVVRKVPRSDPSSNIEALDIWWNLAVGSAMEMSHVAYRHGLVTERDEGSEEVGADGVEEINERTWEIASEVKTTYAQPRSNSAPASLHSYPPFAKPFLRTESLLVPAVPVPAHLDIARCAAANLATPTSTPTESPPTPTPLPARTSLSTTPPNPRRWPDVTCG